MPRWTMLRRAALIMIAACVRVSAQGPIFRGLEDPFPPEATGVLALADFDQDGDVDALSFGVNVFLNDGNARFSPHPTPSVVTTALTSTLDPINAPIYAVADVNGDGFPDVVTAGGWPWTRVWINQGNGVLSPSAVGFPAPSAVNLCAFPSARAIVAGDVDGDGDVDLVMTLECTAYGANQPELFLNTGNGTFVNATNQLPVIAVVSNQLFLRDLDNDGDLDIFLSDNVAWYTCPSTVQRILLNNGSGVFTLIPGFSGPPTKGYVVLADVNGDGLPDVASSPFAATLSCGANCTVSLNLGAAAFGAWGSSACAEAGALVAANLHGNGMDDIVRLTASAITVHSANAAGLSAPLQAIPLPADSAQPVDLDGDGDLDFVITLGSENAVLLRDGQGTLIPVTGHVWGPPNAYSDSSAVVGDVDGDGHPDYVWFAWPTSAPPTVAVALNDGNGKLSVASSFCVGGGCASVIGNAPFCQPRRMFPLDVNGDGRLDLFISHAPQGQAPCTSIPDGLHVNTGGAWSLALSLPASQHETTQVKQGDLNGDGLPDVVVGRQYGLVPSLVLFNHGAQGWSSPVSLPPHATYDLSVYDADGDGDLDLLEANWLPGYDSCTVLLNDGAGNFTPATVPGISSAGAMSVATGDFDGDGDPDVILDHHLWLNTPPLTFTPGPLLPLTGIVHLDVLDAEGDGDLDLIARASTPSTGTYSNQLLLNNGAGTFTVSQVLPGGVLGRACLADLDRDGDVDLIVPGPLVLMNVTRQISRGSILRPGRIASLDVFGPPGGQFLMYASTGTAALQVPAIGTVLLDLSGLQFFAGGTLSPAGAATLSALLPANPSLVGFTTYLQALVTSPPHVTNLEVMTVLGL